jgi:prolyl oligopeptidase
MLMKMRPASVLVAVTMDLALGCAPPPAPIAVSPPPVSPVSSAIAAPKDRAPPADQEPVKDVYHGVEVEDPYRWLEDTSSHRVKAFARAQNEWARKYLDALPDRQAVRARLKEILGARFAAYRHPAAVGRTLFAMKMQPPRQQPMLVSMVGADGVDSERVLVDPDALDSSGHTSIDWFRPSPDGKYVAVSQRAPPG